METMPSLMQIIDDDTYAWEVLQSQVKLQTSQEINGDDIAHLLQLYMRGVQKMNSYLDVRQSFFKNKVVGLMSRQTVIRTLNKPMNKKEKPDQVQLKTPPKKAGNKKQLQLKQKQKEIQMRLAYGAQEHSPEALRKMLAQQKQKQSVIQSHIQKIMDSHEERLAKRIKQRKMRTMTAKSQSQIFINGPSEFNLSKKQYIQKKRDIEQFGQTSCIIQESIPTKSGQLVDRKLWKSLDLQKSQKWVDVKSKRKISLDLDETDSLKIKPNFN